MTVSKCESTSRHFQQGEKAVLWILCSENLLHMGTFYTHIWCWVDIHTHYTHTIITTVCRQIQRQVYCRQDSDNLRIEEVSVTEDLLQETDNLRRSSLSHSLSRSLSQSRAERKRRSSTMRRAILRQTVLDTSCVKVRHIMNRGILDTSCVMVNYIITILAACSIDLISPKVGLVCLHYW